MLQYVGVQCVAVCCSVLQCVAVYCSVLQCDAVCCGQRGTLQHGDFGVTKRLYLLDNDSYGHVGDLRRRLLLLGLTSGCCSVLQCVAVNCSVLQRVAVCCTLYALGRGEPQFASHQLHCVRTYSYV